jgi:ubiquinone biosynthesis protein UbiJ
MLLKSVVRILNHLLLQEKWARVKLQPFAGQAVRLESGAPPVSLTLSITDQGLFEAASSPLVSPTVRISLPTDWPQQAIASGSTIFALAQISGPVDFAEVLGFVFRNLRWDIEGDLSKLVGDVVAHRLVDVSKRFVSWQQDAAKRLAFNLTDFFVEESPSIARAADIATFCTAINAVRDQCDKLEKRFQRLNGP